MKINGLENTLDRIVLTSIDIENQIFNYKLVFYNVRRRDIEWGMRLPMFVPAFYSYILRKSEVPNQENFWNKYIESNQGFFQTVNLTPEQMEGLKARVFRTYPSLVRDLHLGITLKADKSFSNIFYNEVLDIEYGIDLVVINDDKCLGLNLFTNTQIAVMARTIKKYRPKKTVNFDCIELPIEFRGSKVCGDFFLYSEREIQKIKGLILNYV